LSSSLKENYSFDDKCNAIWVTYGMLFDFYSIVHQICGGTKKSEGKRKSSDRSETYKDGQPPRQLYCFPEPEGDLYPGFVDFS